MSLGGMVCMVGSTYNNLLATKDQMPGKTNLNNS
uniref:Uncharacterized protein n=1 Tax=Arundo donax TaxID=35708 RepID=A0A0A8YE62_ARUDO